MTMPDPSPVEKLKAAIEQLSGFRVSEVDDMLLRDKQGPLINRAIVLALPEWAGLEDDSEARMWQAAHANAACLLDYVRKALGLDLSVSDDELPKRVALLAAQPPAEDDRLWEKEPISVVAAPHGLFTVQVGGFRQSHAEASNIRDRLRAALTPAAKEGKP